MRALKDDGRKGNTEEQEEAKYKQLVSLTNMASDYSKKYLSTIPLIYYFVLKVAQKTWAEPRLVKKVCDMYRLTHLNESMAHVKSCNGCYTSPPCLAMVKNIALADVPSSVNEINLDAAFGDESINYTEWRVSFLGGAEISFLFFCTMVLAKIRGKKVSDWLTCPSRGCRSRSTKEIDEDAPHTPTCEGLA